LAAKVQNSILWGIAQKLSHDLSGILATRRAQFHADGWNPGGQNHDRTKI